MDFIEKRLLECAVHVPKILIPTNKSDHISWPGFPAVNDDLNASLLAPLNAGNLMNSKDYSSDLENELNLPERKRYVRTYKNMKRAVRSGFLTEYKGFILTRRINKSGVERYGLLILLDYEDYLSDNPIIAVSREYNRDIATAQADFMTNAIFDLQYAQALIEDQEATLIEPLVASTFHFKKIFSFNHPVFGIYEGFLIDTPQHFTLISNAFAKIKAKSIKNNKSLFLVHEGVESFESGLIHWNRLKEQYGNRLYRYNPARFHLVELFNIYSPDINLVPYNVLVKDISHDKLVTQFRAKEKIKVETLSSVRELHEAILKRSEKYGSVCYGLICDDVSYLVTFRTSESDIGIINIQDTLAKLMQENEHSVSYHINISEMLIEYAEGKHTAIIMPPIKKDTFFDNIAKHGRLNRHAYCHDIPANLRFLFEARFLQ